jgi:hypothetical protein
MAELLAQTSKGQQLFAVRLDDALQKLLIADVNRSFDDGGWDVSGLSSRFQPEIESMISVAYYLCSLGIGKATPGMEVMNLQLNQRFQESTDRIMATKGSAVNSSPGPGPGWWDRLQSSTRTAPIAGIVLVYLFRRLELAGFTRGWSSAPEGSWRRRCYLCLSVLRTSFRIAGVANTLLFLWNGAFVNVFNRVFGFRMLSAIAASVSPGYTNTLQYLKSRQIAWLAVLQLLGSVTYVLASSDTHLLHRSVNTSANAAVDVAGVDWGVLGVWAQRLGRRATRTTAQVVNTARRYFRAGIRTDSAAVNSESPGSIENENENEGARLHTLPRTVSEPETASALKICSSSPSSSSSSAAASLCADKNTRTSEIPPASISVPVPVPVPRCVYCTCCPAENAQKSSCGHLYCYFCLVGIDRQNMLWVSASNPGDRDGMDQPYLCPVCDEVVVSCR